MSKAKRFTDIMLDLETLSTRPDGVILSIGAVKFDPNSYEMDDKAFYASISIDSNHEVASRHISESTLLWWMQQSAEAKVVFTEAKTTLEIGLQDLQDWIDHPEYKVWSNGADFDIPMIGHAYSVHGYPIPWKFWNTGCFRTMKNLNIARSVPKPANALAHNALQDAITQAKHLQAINAAICGEKQAA